MAFVAWQQHQWGKKKQCDHAHKIRVVKHKPDDPQFQQQQEMNQPLQQGGQ